MKTKKKSRENKKTTKSKIGRLRSFFVFMLPNGK